MISAGVFFGAPMPAHALVSKPGRKSATVGTSGSPSKRAVAVTAVFTAVAYLTPAVRHHVFGMLERLLYVAMIAWLLIAALHVVVLAG